MSRSVLIRFAAMLLLAVQAQVLAGAPGARASVCPCRHASSVPCGCPMHGQAQESVGDDARLPPCHRHRLKVAPPATPLDEAPCLRAGCSATEPELWLFAWLTLPNAVELDAMPRSRLPPWAKAPTSRPSRIPVVPPPRAAS